jgi:DNA-binding Xre family transcriptional regulator
MDNSILPSGDTVKHASIRVRLSEGAGRDALIQPPAEMRLRIPELFEERGLTPYAAAKASSGRINESTLYRLQRQRGRVEFFNADLLEALCDLLDVEPGELFERERPRRRAR